MSDQRLGIEGFTEEERREILEQIDEISRKSAIRLGKDSFDFQAKRRGFLFPLAVNILAIIAMAAAVLYANRVFQAREAELSAEAQSYLSAEGKLLEELKRESSKKLNEKEDEIDRIEQELARIDSEKEALEANVESQIRDKERELEAALKEAIARERARLSALGTGEKELEKRLEAFRREQEDAFTQQLSSFRRESREALEEKQQELEEARQLAQQILEEANQDKRELLEESRRREEELRSGFERERRELEAESEAAQKKLQELAEARQNEQLYLDQIEGGYKRMIEAISANERSSADAELEKLRQLINSEKAGAAPSLEQRKEIDIFFLSLLQEKLYTIEGRDEQEEQRGLIDLAQRLRAAIQASKRGREAREAGEINQAAEAYSSALEQLPEIAHAAEGLYSIRNLRRSQRSEEYLKLASEALEENAAEEAKLQTAAALFESASASEENETAARKALELYSFIDKMKQDKLEAALEKNEEQKASLERTIDESRNRQEGLQDEISSLQAEKEQYQEELKKNRQELQELERQAQSLSNELDAAQRAGKSLAEDLAEQRQELYASQARIERLSKANRSLEQDLEEAADQLASLISTRGSDSVFSNAVRTYRRFAPEEGLPVEDADRRLRELLESEAFGELFPGIDALVEASSMGE